MSNEAQVQAILTLSVGNYQYQNKPGSFQADVSAAGAAGPTPGSVLATLGGTQIDLSKLTTPGGLAVITNSDPTNFIEVGVYDPSTTYFTPIIELLPGESYIVRLARNMGREYGAGTGTTGSNTILQARVDPSAATGTTALLIVNAFNK